MNPEAERLLGWAEAELTGKTMHNIIHNQKADGTPLPSADCPACLSVKKKQRYSSTDEVFIRKDGTVFPVSLLAAPLMEDGKFAGAVAAFQDITLTKKMEEDILRNKKLESIADMAGGIAHDFNNLLMVIYGYISLSKGALKPDDIIFKNLTVAEDACLSVKNLIYQLTTVAKGHNIVKTITSLAVLLKDSAISSMGDSECCCEFSIPDNLWNIEVDEIQMSLVMSNLVKNALEAMPDGGVVGIEAENIIVGADHNEMLVTPGRYIHISVSDQGVGIPKKNIHRIFDPYFTTKKKDFHKGVGLGLAVCYSIIKMHGGYLFADSKVGKGTTVSIYLPAAEPNA